MSIRECLRAELSHLHANGGARNAAHGCSTADAAPESFDDAGDGLCGGTEGAIHAAILAAPAAANEPAAVDVSTATAAAAIPQPYGLFRECGCDEYDGGLDGAEDGNADA